MKDDDFKTYYTEQRELLREAFSEIGQKTELILTVGQLLMENGADTAQTVRDMQRVAAYMGIPAEKFHLHIMFTTLMLNISDEHHSHTSFRKCPKRAVNMQIISSISRLTWRALREHYTLDEFKGELEAISKRPRYPHWLSILAAGSGCGSFCTLFGCDFNAAIYTAISAIIGKIVQMQCVERFGFNPYVSMTFAAFVALSVADLMHYLPTATPWHPMIAASLFLVPGIPIINAFSDMLNTYLISGAARILHTLIIVGATSFGIVLAIAMSDFNVFEGLPTLPESNYLLFAAAGAIGAASFAVFFNLPKRVLIAAALGGAICVCTRNFLTFELGMSSAVGTLAGATLVSVLAVKAIHWLHTPSLVLVVPAVIPLVPGVMIYYSLFAAINIHLLSPENLVEAIQISVNALLIILAIAIGASMPTIFASRSFQRKSKEKQEKLLNEIYETRD
ncbi:MAG: threonine/serine exporter family protein [Quinella sp. 3Q1]|nr:threonine/serine exporter family protein [Quinella sp. 3Q1]MBR3050706.1 threonine/serine exporter family protein [Selenomonadaceae bacterium]MBR6888737.1 threonine/serine exporter family protein [Selenomonadaceae bacterium]